MSNERQAAVSYAEIRQKAVHFGDVFARSVATGKQLADFALPGPNGSQI